MHRFSLSALLGLWFNIKNKISFKGHSHSKSLNAIKYFYTAGSQGLDLLAVNFRLISQHNE